MCTYKTMEHMSNKREETNKGRHAPNDKSPGAGVLRSRQANRGRDVCRSGVPQTRRQEPDPVRLGTGSISLCKEKVEEVKGMGDLQQQLLNNLYDYISKMNQVLDSFNITMQALNEVFNERQRQAFEQSRQKPESGPEAADET